MGKRKWYVVWVGRKPGIYTTWSECQEQVDGYSKAKYQSFRTEQEARDAFGEKEVEEISDMEQKLKRVIRELRRHRI